MGAARKTRAVDPRRRVPVFLGWLVVLASPIAFLALCEALLAAFWPQAPGWAPGAHVEERDGIAFLRPGEGFEQTSREFRVRIQANSLGYRAGLGGEEVDGAILVLGDSFAFGWGVEASEAATAIALEAGLHVVNMAMPGDGLAEYRERLDRTLRARKKPAAVVFVTYENDFWRSEALRNGPNELVTTVRGKTSPRLFTQAWLLRLHTANLVGRGLRAIGLASVSDRIGGIAEARRRVLLGDLEIHRRGYPATSTFRWAADRLNEAILMAKAHAAKVLLVRISALSSVDARHVAAVLAEVGEPRDAYDFEALDVSLASLAKDARVPYVRFPRPTDGSAERLYFAWDRHLNPAGQRALAQCLIGELRNLGLEQERRPLRE